MLSRSPVEKKKTSIKESMSEKKKDKYIRGRSEVRPNKFDKNKNKVLPKDVQRKRRYSGSSKESISPQNSVDDNQCMFWEFKSIATREETEDNKAKNNMWKGSTLGLKSQRFEESKVDTKRHPFTPKANKTKFRIECSNNELFTESLKENIENWNYVSENYLIK